MSVERPDEIPEQVWNLIPPAARYRFAEKIALKNTVRELRWASPEEESSFFILSPLMASEEWDIEHFMFIIGILKLAQTPEGLDVLKAWGIEYIRAVKDIVTDLSSSATSNWLCAVLNNTVSVSVLRRVGLITPKEAHEIQSRFAWIFKLVIAKEGITDTLTSLGTFMKGVSGVSKLVK